jgi:hypothetical protein
MLLIDNAWRETWTRNSSTMCTSACIILRMKHWLPHLFRGCPSNCNALPGNIFNVWNIIHTTMENFFHQRNINKIINLVSRRVQYKPRINETVSRTLISTRNELNRSAIKMDDGNHKIIQIIVHLVCYYRNTNITCMQAGMHKYTFHFICISLKSISKRNRLQIIYKHNLLYLH